VHTEAWSVELLHCEGGWGNSHEHRHWAAILDTGGCGAADKLKSYNLDIVYGDDILYPGQQLRLPIHICFEDEKLDCHIVKAKEALESIAKTYKTTAVDLCKTNSDVILPQEPHPCDGWAIGIAVVVGMELSVPTLRPAPPSPCREIPDYWSCYTVKANDTIYIISAITPGIASRFGISADELIEVNFGKSPNRCGLAPPNYTEGCSNTTHCPPSKGPYPDCLKTEDWTGASRSRRSCVCAATWSMGLYTKYADMQRNDGSYCSCCSHYCNVCAFETATRSVLRGQLPCLSRMPQREAPLRWSQWFCVHRTLRWRIFNIP
jgi:LysM repeat protein